MLTLNLILHNITAILLQPFSVLVLTLWISEGLTQTLILILRAGIPRPTGNCPESLAQATLVGIMLVGRFGVQGKIVQK